MEIKRLSKELLIAKKAAHETYLRLALRNESNCCSDFYKYVKGGKERWNFW
jgi:hypothetical protein